MSLPLSLFLGAALLAQSPTQTAPQLQNNGVNATPVQTQLWKSVRAEDWGLTEAELKQYQLIMSGPRGIWSPNLDPITALGVSSKTDAERQKWAERSIKQEIERADSELAFTRAYFSAFKRLYPNQPLMIPPGMNLSATPSVPATSPMQTRIDSLAMGDRVVLFFAPDACPNCAALVAHIAKSMPLGVGLDLYVQGTPAAVNAWALRSQLPPQLVASKRITLNPENGQFQKITAGKASMPASFIRRGEREFIPLAGPRLMDPSFYASADR